MKLKSKAEARDAKQTNDVCGREFQHFRLCIPKPHQLQLHSSSHVQLQPYHLPSPRSSRPFLRCDALAILEHRLANLVLQLLVKGGTVAKGEKNFEEDEEDLPVKRG